jgi:hypothetical protein
LSYPGDLSQKAATHWKLRETLRMLKVGESMTKLRKSLTVSNFVSALLLFRIATADSLKPKQESVQPLFQGLGSVHHPVSTSSPLAQQYFDQGLSFAYGFNHVFGLFSSSHRVLSHPSFFGLEYP